jgi:hypothetical protein
MLSSTSSLVLLPATRESINSLVGIMIGGLPASSRLRRKLNPFQEPEQADDSSMGFMMAGVGSGVEGLLLVAVTKHPPCSVESSTAGHR